jgi:hypothetical protein
MLYVKVDENDVVVKFPYSQAAFKIDNPNTSWPEVIDDELLKTYGVHRVQEVPFPTHMESRTRSIEQSHPVKYGNTWTQVFTINKLKPEFAEANQRGKRNGLLTLTDWTQLDDSGLAPEKVEAFRVYRQELRDLPDRPGWPYDVSWPTSPEVADIVTHTVG